MTATAQRVARHAATPVPAVQRQIGFRLNEHRTGESADVRVFCVVFTSADVSLALVHRPFLDVVDLCCLFEHRAVVSPRKWYVGSERRGPIVLPKSSGIVDWTLRIDKKNLAATPPFCIPYRLSSLFAYLEWQRLVPQMSCVPFRAGP